MLSADRRSGEAAARRMRRRCCHHQVSVLERPDIDRPTTRGHAGMRWKALHRWTKPAWSDDPRTRRQRPGDADRLVDEPLRDGGSCPKGGTPERLGQATPKDSAGRQPPLRRLTHCSPDPHITVECGSGDRSNRRKSGILVHTISIIDHNHHRRALLFL